MGCPFELLRIALGKIGTCSFPNLIEITAEDLPFDGCAFFGGKGFDTVVCTVQFIQLLCPYREEGALLQYLYFHTHLEHIGSRCHHDIGNISLGQDLTGMG
ncbi:MAG TPA: hypothetical protein PKC19_12660 [Roseiflexaceae bacterium]|nr:hypothetical protein [Roseiflexaceae bacterium]